jgi:dienelactone hydrolase
LNAPVLKTGSGESRSWVRIPPHPPCGFAANRTVRRTGLPPLTEPVSIARLAKLGYLAIAPEVYARQGDVSQITDFKESIAKVVSKVPDKQVLGDLDAAVAWAKTSGNGDTSKLAITGFCRGGRIVWLYAAHNPNLEAGVAWYGRLDSQKDEPHPVHPVDVVVDLKAQRDRALPRYAPRVLRRLQAQL